MVTLHETPVDDPAAGALLAEYFAVRAAGFPGDYRPVMPARETFEGAAGVFLVAVADAADEGVTDGEPVGCGGIRAVPDGPLGRRDEVKHLYVRPTGRGRGWGRAMLAELERHARDRGATELVLDTHHTLTEAAGLYTVSGFVPVEPYNDNPNATVWLSKVLSRVA